MKLAERDNEQLGVIIVYCERLHSSVARFGDSFEAFQNDEQYQDSVSLCLIQIGEAVNRLSNEFRKLNADIDWRRIYGMRCHLVYGYGMFDAEIAWDAVKNEIPKLDDFCRARFVE
jgi:uncharacterized protein with HEPN domain